MFSCRTILGAVALFASTALPSWAEDYALLLTNRDYARLDDARDVARHAGFRSALEQNGFTVFQGRDLDTWGQMRLASEFDRVIRAGQVDRLIVVLAGHFVDGPADSWLLSADSGGVSALNVGQNGLSVGAISAVLADFPGKGLLVLSPSAERLMLGAGLSSGVSRFPRSQGVSLLEAPADRALSLVRDQVLRGRSLAALAQSTPFGVSWSGYLPDHPLGGQQQDQSRPDPDNSYWQAARDIDTIDSYRAYLRRYPSGRFAIEARNRIAAIEDAPRREAQAAEAALNLSRDARRDIQRHLSLLGFDTRGIDGIFGQGTRTAISAYQRSKGLPDTGYVTGNLIIMLQRDAQVRARQLEEEERERRLIEERRDRALWQSVVGTGEEGLRRYLRRYPDGIYADQARRRLAEIEEHRRATSDRQISAAWDRARTEDTVEAYRDFIRRYPNSDFQDAAQERIAELQEAEQNRDQIERDKAQEAIVASSQALRVLIERNLKDRGYEPGSLDGTFDQDTRRALRKFQRANGMVVTGYVSQETMIRLMVPIIRN